MAAKKGRAQRVGAAPPSSAPSEKASEIGPSLDVHHEGKYSIVYTAHNGCHYRVDVSEMTQTNLLKGSKRTVHRHQGRDKRWTMWQFEASRAAGRNYTHSRTTYVQYPRPVCAALEDCFREFRRWEAKGESREAIEAREAWQEKLFSLTDATICEFLVAGDYDKLAIKASSLLRVCASKPPLDSGCNDLSQRNDLGLVGEFSENSITTNDLGKTRTKSKHSDETMRSFSHEDSEVGVEQSALPSERGYDGVKMAGDQMITREITENAPSDEVLRRVIFERLLHSRCAANHVAQATRCLISNGFQATPAHCRQVALVRGSILVLRVLLVEARVDVRGLVLMADGDATAVGRDVGCIRQKQATIAAEHSKNSSWVQLCKPALKALLARGAVLGNGAKSSRSKLLKRLEEDGDALWAQRAVEGIRCSYQDIPDLILNRIREFVGLSSRLENYK